MECFGSAVVNTSMTCLSQGYGYDNLNRLTTAGENYYQNPSSGAGYSRNFSYDEYGNMSVSASANVPTSGLMPQTSQSPFNTANNQLKTATYADPRGNMTLVAANSVSMSYDGESRQTKTVDPGTGLTMNYLYAAAGQRVQKQSSNGTTTVDVHDVFGQLVAEYSSVGVTPACTTCYLTYDGLGSVRLVTDQNAGIVTRHDYLPYGEEIPNGSAGRCCNNFGNTANVTQMFTGQERDGGTADLDYFNARHMSNILGRFTQPDPGGAGADVTNPQTWNAYAYVVGNPLGMTDPSGMIGLGNGTDEEEYEWSVGDNCGGICYFPPTYTHHGGATYGGGVITVASLPPSNSSPTTTATTAPTTASSAPVSGTCESGGCGVASGFADGGTLLGIGDALKNSVFWWIYFPSLPYGDFRDPNHRFFGTHYCGPGGGGRTTSKVDEGCLAHDKCYDDHHIDFWPNVGRGTWTSAQAESAKSCNQKFYNTVSKYPNEAGATSIRYWLTYGEKVGILYPGTGVKP